MRIELSGAVQFADKNFVHRTISIVHVQKAKHIITVGSQWGKLKRTLKEIVLNSIKYLGVTISSVLSDELDIKARVRSIYCIANMLRTRFFKCSVNVKNILFRYFYSSIYGINLWCRYPASSINRLRELTTMLIVYFLISLEEYTSMKLRLITASRTFIR